MEGKALGICLCVVGIISLALAFFYMNSGDSSKHLSLLFASGIAGTLTFFTGLWLIPGTGKGAGYENKKMP